jgi:LysR family transcriptional regulator, hypochlorite-specific transcription factor HypT
VELTWLKDFLALARSESFSRAADERGVTQPAFSRRIRALETWLGAVLVDRDTHRIALTPAGVKFVEIADATVRAIEHGRKEVQEIAHSSRSSLRFVSTHALSLTVFPSLISDVQMRSPREVPVQLTADNMQAGEQLMLQGRAQFLLCHHHPAATTALDPRNFSSIALGRDCLIPLSLPDPAGGAPRHALPGRPETPSALLAYGEESGMGRIIAAAQGASGTVAHLAPIFTSHAVMVLAAMARDGYGLAWLPASLVQADIDAGRLVRAGDAQWDVPMEIRLYRPRARQSATAEAFWALVQQSPAAVVSGMD